jgi:hypothetical protein
MPPDGATQQQRNSKHHDRPETPRLLPTIPEMNTDNL